MVATVKNAKTEYVFRGILWRRKQRKINIILSFLSLGTRLANSVYVTVLASESYRE